MSDDGTEIHETEGENSRTQGKQERAQKQQSQGSGGDEKDDPERGGSSGDREERPPSPQTTSSTDGLSEGTDDTAGMDQRERSSTSRFVTSTSRRFPNPGMFIVLRCKGNDRSTLLGTFPSFSNLLQKLKSCSCWV